MQKSVAALATNVESAPAAGHGTLCAALKTRLGFERNQSTIRELLNQPDLAGANVIASLETLSKELCPGPTSSE